MVLQLILILVLSAVLLLHVLLPTGITINITDINIRGSMAARTINDSNDSNIVSVITIAAQVSAALVMRLLTVPLMVSVAKAE